ncbi:MAG: hypothetical protein DME15_16950 [Candidatus Rokuibacteriota bacterium]|nr:MAG: hypothetical protein DME15_16950 [Candidatus Rokubacteria bacterium]
MRQMLRMIFGCVAVGTLVLASGPARAQTTSNGPYYATPSWDQKLDCTTMATCPRFIVLLNWSSAAVLDRETGLVWERSPANTGGPNGNGSQTWLGAQSYCNQLNLGNRKGWHLPTIQELASLVDGDPANISAPKLPPGHPFMGVQPATFYWSATSNAADAGSAWGLGFLHGEVFDVAKTYADLVWCVRGGQGVDPQ